MFKQVTFDGGEEFHFEIGEITFTTKLTNIFKGLSPITSLEINDVSGFYKPQPKRLGFRDYILKYLQAKDIKLVLISHDRLGLSSVHIKNFQSGENGIRSWLLGWDILHSQMEGFINDEPLQISTIKEDNTIKYSRTIPPINWSFLLQSGADIQPFNFLKSGGVGLISTVQYENETLKGNYKWILKNFECNAYLPSFVKEYKQSDLEIEYDVEVPMANQKKKDIIHTEANSNSKELVSFLDSWMIQVQEYMMVIDQHEEEKKRLDDNNIIKTLLSSIQNWNSRFTSDKN